MKKILITFLILSLILISSCSLFENGENGMNTTKMTAKIIAINEKLEVEVIEGEYGASGIYWVITGADTFFEDAQGNKISRSELGEGDIIIIEYNGQVMMSYPPQISARRITVK